MNNLLSFDQFINESSVTIERQNSAYDAISNILSFAKTIEEERIKEDKILDLQNDRLKELHADARLSLQSGDQKQIEMAEKTFSQQYKMYGNAVDIAFKKYIKATKDYQKFVASALAKYNAFGGPKANSKVDFKQILHLFDDPYTLIKSGVTVQELLNKLNLI